MEEDEKMEEADTMEEAKNEMEEDEKMDETYSYQEEGMDQNENMDEASLEELLAELEEGEDTNEEDKVNEAELDEAEGDMDLEEMSEDELKSFVEEVIEDMVQAGELEAGGDPVEMSDEEEEEEGKEEMEMDSMEEVNIDELLSEEDVNEFDLAGAEMIAPELIGGVIAALGALGLGAAIDKEELKKMSSDKLKALAAKLGVGKKNEEVEEGDIEEMKEELDELKGELSEVNLLNAKLLYTNKLFRSRSLTESQKVKVLSTFDKATSVKEVKLVFETLSDSLTTSQVVKENKGSASRPTGGASKNPQPILESNDQVRRWQKLAGITTDKSYT